MAARRSAGVLLNSPNRWVQLSSNLPSTYALSTLQTRSFFDSLLSSALGPCEPRSMSHTKVLPHPAATIFKAVSDVAGYPNFLPFTISSNVRSRDPKGYPTRASLKVGYPKLGIEEDWESIVRCDASKGTIEARSSEEHSNGLFEILATKWHIEPSKTADASTAVKLEVNVKFRNPMYDQMFAQVEGKVASTMISAFEKRVQELDQRQKPGP
ncbi:Coenzyme Q-binding protein coq10, mitochondrial [Cladophialophora chaetospira]|uniref:Coenzyme Q-binding protein coq10, mitochondrial n=1 Tax=Cladophialophora chaetospira TaxID=386627 RepID=A0AA38X1L5_9EURO|nr:Coenzyme Q-binding protein coq10, mitochondrial [Cladophialophora chaetospira]